MSATNSNKFNKSNTKDTYHSRYHDKKINNTHSKTDINTKDTSYSRFYLKKLTSSQCKADISSRSDEFKSIQAPIMIDKDGNKTTIDKNQYIQDLCDDIDNCDRVYYGHVKAPDDDEIIRMVIGKGGCYFYLTTEMTNILFIWHNRITKNFEFWGQYPGRVIAAMREIDKRITISLNNKVKVLNKKLDNISMSNSMIFDNIKYNKTKIGNIHYFVEDDKKELPRVHTIIGENKLGKYIGTFIKYDNFTKGPTIRIDYDNIVNDDDVKNNDN
jgi:hypothetical protein